MYLPNELELVNNIIKSFKEDDSASKQWAFVNVCQFIMADKVPPYNVILQVEDIIYKCLFHFSIKLANFISVIEALCFYFSYSKNCKLATVVDKSRPLIRGSSLLRENTNSWEKCNRHIMAYPNHQQNKSPNPTTIKYLHME